MKLKVQLRVGDKLEWFTFDTDKFGRNYDDENYAYWIIRDKLDRIHEVNINKDGDGNLTPSGYDYVWFTEGDFVDGTNEDLFYPITFEKTN